MSGRRHTATYTSADINQFARIEAGIKLEIERRKERVKVRGRVVCTFK